MRRTTDVLISAAVQQSVASGMVQPSDASLVEDYAHARAAAPPPGENDMLMATPHLAGPLPDGTTPLLWNLAGAHVLDIVAADYADAGGRVPAGANNPARLAEPRSSLLPEGHYDRDPSVTLTEGGCTDTARGLLADAAHCGVHPLDMLAYHSSTANTPCMVRQAVGLGARIGNDLSAAAKIHQTRVAAHRAIEADAASLSASADTGRPAGGSQRAVHASALVVLSTAHQHPPQTPEFAGWVLANLHGENKPNGMHPAAWAVSGLLATATYTPEETPLAVAALAVIDELVPKALAAGISDFFSCCAETDEDIGALVSNLQQAPTLHSNATPLLRRGMKRYESRERHRRRKAARRRQASA